MRVDAATSDGNTTKYERASPQWVALAAPGVDATPQLKDRANHFVFLIQIIQYYLATRKVAKH